MTARHIPDKCHWSRVTPRVLLAVVGGYWLSAGLAALLAAGLSALMEDSEAVVLMAMLAFVIYLLVLLWAFAEARLSRLWVVLGGGALAVQALVWWLAPTGAGG